MSCVKSVELVGALQLEEGGDDIVKREKRSGSPDVERVV